MTPEQELSPLPALRHLGDLRERRATVVVDTREQTPLPITRLPTIRAGLYSGDYSVAGLESVFAVERKSIADFVGCCLAANRERFERELHRLRGFAFRRLLIVGTRAEIEAGEYRSKIKPESVLATIHCFEYRYNIPVVWCDTPELGAAQVEFWAWYAAREAVLACNDMLRETAEQASVENKANVIEF